MRFRRQGPSLVVDAPAKLNLFLEVCGKRPDGYHELETVMVSIGLFDTLRFTPLPDGRFPLRVLSGGVETACVPAGDDNLVVLAARLLATATGCRQGAQIELVKRIPAASGLGGGSSDAAATLVALNRLWQTGLAPRELHLLAAQLGSDLNFFLGSPLLAVCRGRGEYVEPRPLLRRLHFVIVRPPSGLSTAEVFREWRPHTVRRSAADLLDGAAQGDCTTISRQLFNALTAPAERLNPDVARTLRALERVGGSGQMTGSGSACFSMAISRRQARVVGARLRQLRAGRVWVVESCS